MMMPTSDTSGKKISFSSAGLDLLKMGSKVSADARPYLIDIDTSTTEGFMEYISINPSFYMQEGYVYKKLVSKKIVFRGMEQAYFDLLVAVSPKDEVKAIRIRFKTDNCDTLKSILTKVYGQHNIEATTDFELDSNQIAYASFYWSHSGFEIRLSGPEVDIFYATPPEYIEKLLREHGN